MTVCRFYQQGNCKFGDQCKFEHPGAQRNQNRFGAFQNAGHDPRGNQPRGHSGGRYNAPRNNAQRDWPYRLSPEVIETDLTSDRPQWPASAYGPGRDPPRQMFGGYPLEQSPEELRVQYYLGMVSGNVQAAIQVEQELVQQSQQQISNVLRDLNGACQYIADGKNDHPNRWDVCKASSANSVPSQQQQPRNPFGVAPQAASSFGRPSAVGPSPQRPAFGAPSFGQPSGLGPSQPQHTAFGQPSSFGQPSAPGRTTGFGQSATFGQPSSFGQSSTFGQPSAFGKPSTVGAQPTAFGQPSSLGSNPPASFGQPSAFGGNAPLPLASAAQPGPTSTFGQPSAFGTQTSSPFAHTAQPAATGAFGQPSSTLSNGPAGGFGRPSGGSPAFGAPIDTGGSSGFGQPAIQPAINSATMSDAPNPFTRGLAPAPNATTTTTTNAPISNGFPAPPPAPAPAQPTPMPPSSDPSTYTTRNPQTNRLTSFKGRPVTYIGDAPHYRRADDGQPERIWFPDGPPAPNPWAEPPPEAYGGAVGAFEEAYRFVAERGQFRDGVMPEEPPRREWVRWDL